MSVKLLAEHHLKFLRLIGDCTGLSESTLVKIPHFRKSHVTAQYYNISYCLFYVFLNKTCKVLQLLVGFFSSYALHVT